LNRSGSIYRRQVGKEVFVPLDVFEKYAKDYDRWFDEHRKEYLSELARIRRVFPATGPRSIEIGVGSGRFAAPLGIALGVDPSRALCRMAHLRGIEAIRGKAEALPIRTECCSSVLMVTVICFLDDPEAAFRELHRILIPGGIFILGFIERGGQVARRYLKEEGKHRFLSRARFYSVDEVLTLLSRTGLRETKIDSRAGFCVIAAQRL
jgi:SAM-dependent methyltransferase